VPDEGLHVRDLRVRYGGVAAVQGVTLTVRPGEVVGLAGPNGSGKSSVLKAISGLAGTESGTVALDGRDLLRLSAERRARAGVALVPEGRGILGPLTVRENLFLGTYAAGRLDRAVIAERMDEAFEMFPRLRERADQVAGTLSGGEAAMLAVTRALMSRPRLLLLDEPTLGLAPLAADRLFEQVAALKSAEMVILLVEEKAAGLLDVADRLLLMRQGTVTDVGATADVTTDRLESLYFGS
jgi:branched-chain amino acid transport system ATP-binding protein